MEHSTTEAIEYDPHSAVAIIGMAGRFPNAPSVEMLWQNIAAGVVSLHTFTDAELHSAGVDPALINNPQYVKVGTIVPDIDRFDAPFFGYTPQEAALMDPQHRLFLECAWEALEHAAYDPETYPGLIGVFGGSGFCTYLLNNLFTHPDLLKAAGKLQIAAGNERDSLTTMVSYKFNLRGPSVAVQTFCSTSLVAVHMACQSLLNYECDLALAGGVAITVPQEQGYLYEEGNILSPDGVCRTFDAQANGSVMGNGLGLVTLKRLDEALEDGDTVYAVIRGSAVNNDGSVRVGYTAPGLEGQAGVIAEALAHANVAPETISYLECHGTATPLGDAIEMAAMIQAFSLNTQQKQFCAIGAIKPNIGHLDRASGVTGLIKTALALHHRQLPPSLHFERPNPDIDLANSPFYVNTVLREWRRGAAPRRAGVSSFGLGGTNAHVVLEEALERPPAQPGRASHVLLLSAKTQPALEAATKQLALYLRENPQLSLADVAYTLQVGRSAFSHRRMVVCATLDTALAALESGDLAQRQTAQVIQRDRPLAAACGSLGLAQWPVIQRLYASEARVQAEIDSACQVLRQHYGWDVRAAFTAPLAAEPDLAMQFVAGYAWLQALVQSGVQLSQLYGAGIGELATACVAGVLPRDTALALIAQQAGRSAAQPMAQVLQTPEIALFLQSAGAQLSLDQATNLDWWRERVTLAATPFDPKTLEFSQAHATVVLGAGAAELVASQAIIDLAQCSSAAPLPELLAACWLAGAAVEWKDLYAQEQRYRVALPTYPFERQRYWVDAQAAAPVAQARAAGKDPAMERWFYRPVWQQALAPQIADIASGCRDRGPWLVFTQEDQLTAACVAELRRLGAAVTLVRPGAGFAQLQPDVYTVDPAQVADYAQLFRSLAQPPQTIIHGWSLTALSSDSSATTHTLGFFSLLAVARALGNQVQPCRVWGLTREALAIIGTEDHAPEQAAVAGACKVITQEYGHITCHHLDLSLPDADSWQSAALVHSLIQEWISEPAAIAQAYRQTQRWTQICVPWALPATDTPVFRQRGVYLITGGLGGIGLVIAEHLARTAQARLILTSRTGLPARPEWPRLLAEDGPQRPMIAAIQQLEALGADVLVLQADVTDEAAMRAAVDQAHDRFGPINGVIHAAGISDPSAFGIIYEVTREACERHFAPKITGTQVLERVLAGERLDFGVVMSSLSSVLGGLAFSGYTAANIVLDELVQAHNRRASVPWLSINWDTWGLRADQHSVIGATVAVYEMTPAEGIAVLERALTHARHAGRVIISTGDLSRRLEQWVRHSDEPDVPASVATILHPRPLLATAYMAPTYQLEERIAAIWHQVLGIREIGIYDSFLDLGGNSLIATQVITRLRQEFQLNLPLTLLFDAPTIEALALAIELALIEEIEQMSNLTM